MQPHSSDSLWASGMGLCACESHAFLRLQALKAAIAKAKASKVQESATAEAEKKLQELRRIADREAATAALHAASEGADLKALQAAIENAEACSVPEKAGEDGVDSEEGEKSGAVGRKS